jgi:hypothetical protein
MLNVAHIHLRQELVQEECIQAVKAIVILIRHLSDVDYQYLDPIIIVCWATAASFLLQMSEKCRQGGAQSTLSMNMFNADHDFVMKAMKILSVFFPLAGGCRSFVLLTNNKDSVGDQIRKLELERAQLELFGTSALGNS